MGVAITAAFVLPDYPATTKWLSDEEKAYAQWRLVDDIGESDEGDAASIKDGVKMAFRDPRLYLFTLLQHTSLLSQSFQYFFPTIVKTLGYGNIETLLITAPVWIGTFLVSLVVTYTSGKYHDRSIHIICLMMISVIGNIIVVSSLNTGESSWSRLPLHDTWSSTNPPMPFHSGTLFRHVSHAHGRSVCLPDHRRMGVQQLPAAIGQEIGLHLHRQHDWQLRKHLWIVQ